jgi:hypothetical protein
VDVTRNGGWPWRRLVLPVMVVGLAASCSHVEGGRDVRVLSNTDGHVCWADQYKPRLCLPYDLAGPLRQIGVGKCARLEWARPESVEVGRARTIRCPANLGVPVTEVQSTDPVGDEDEAP